MPAKRYFPTAEDDDLLRRRYDGRDPAAITGLCELLGWPRYVLTRRAGKLGLRRRKERRWTEADEDYLLDSWGQIADQAVATHLGRTPLACLLKAGRLGITRRMNVLCLRQVARLFGVDEHLVSRHWIARGWISARKSPIRCGNGQRIWEVDQDSLESFVRDYPWVYDVRRMAPGEYWTNLAKEVHAADPWLTTSEASRLIGVDRNNIADYCRLGYLAARRTTGMGAGWIWKIRRADALGWQWRRPDLVGHEGRGRAGEGVEREGFR